MVSHHPEAILRFGWKILRQLKMEVERKNQINLLNLKGFLQRANLVEQLSIIHLP